MSKTCSRCGEVKPLDEFNKDRTARDGRRTCCKPCYSAYGRERRNANRERLRSVDDSNVAKKCRDCGAHKPAADFHRSPSALDGRQSQCKLCTRARHLMRQYGLTQERFAAMLASQNGGCAICGTATPGGSGAFHVDHDHTCCPGEKTCGACVRGLLCKGCNTRLGYIESYKSEADRWDAYLEGGAAA